MEFVFNLSEPPIALACFNILMVIGLLLASAADSLAGFDNNATSA